jgi:hypothetical protein
MTPSNVTLLRGVFFTSACLPYLGQYMRARAVVNPPDKEKVITPKINKE